jgi:NAD+ synthase
MFLKTTNRTMIPQLHLDLPVVQRRLVGFIHEEITRAGMQCAVIGVSGGVDSALVAALASQALGPENVFGMMLPYRDSSPASITDAKKLISVLGIRHELVEITPMVEPMFALDPEMNQVRRGNAMARTRMIMLYDRSARERGLVVGTGNKTEFLLGYSTLHGDAACAIAPIGDLYKTQVWLLAEYLGIPAEIIEKAPSADLWSGQTDEEELGFAYRRVDELLHFMIDEGQEREALGSKGFEDAFIDVVRQRIELNRFKRSLPAIPRIGTPV